MDILFSSDLEYPVKTDAASLTSTNLASAPVIKIASLDPLNIKP